MLKRKPICKSKSKPTCKKHPTQREEIVRYTVPDCHVSLYGYLSKVDF